MIQVLPSRVRVDAHAIVALTGADPGRAVTWSTTTGTIAGLSTITDATGRAFAILNPAAEGAHEVTVTYGS